MTDDERKFYSIALSVLNGPSMRKAWERSGLPGPADIFYSIRDEGACAVQDFISSHYSGDIMKTASDIRMRCREGGITVIDLWDPEYPPLLKEISRPPFVLYRRGGLGTGRMMAVVGTRDSDTTSEKIARRISGELAARGFTIVSGMAVGIDRAAHMGALERGGSTVGILANGIGIRYPSGNRDLYGMMESRENTLLLSEYPPGTLAGKWTFIRRNRIISGMSLGTVVVKGGMKSGAMITARYAAEQNREVFACPGNAFDEGYFGCNSLIKNGAIPVSTTDDILLEFPNAADGPPVSPPSRPDEERAPAPGGPGCAPPGNDPLMDKILSIVSSGGIEVDSIIRECSFHPGEVNRAIMMLEIAGMISRKGNRIYRR